MREPHTAAPRVGIVGAGQLARMTVQAGISLGLTPWLLAASPRDSAALISPHVTIGLPNSSADLTAFAASCDVMTFDHELVDVAALRRLEAEGACLRPSADVMAVAQDKLRQRRDFGSLGLPVPAWRPVRGTPDVAAFASEHGWPVVLKARRGGYDGRGVWIAEDRTAAERVVARAAASGIELLAEAWVPIEREVAVLVARRPGGDAASYPVVETVQAEGICREVVAPAPVTPAVADEAGRIARRIAEALDVTGIMAVELFVTEGRVLINEIATRPHNSGHYSIEGCVTSQFENHLRAIVDWPLGETTLTAPYTVTVNVLGTPDTGDPATRLPAALAIPGVHVHLYQKTPRPGRKIGHVTVQGVSLADARARAHEAAALLAGQPAVEAVR
jgi:5-(carboxyamino)imidazole ribonucleotide synthase